MARGSTPPTKQTGKRNDAARPVVAAPGAVTPLTELSPALLTVLVIVPVIFNLVTLWPELLNGVPPRNDSAFHLLMIRGANDALSHGGNVLDFWIPQLDLGFPQFLYYQNFPHLAVVLFHRATFSTVSLETVYTSVRYVLLVAFPVTVYWSMRHMGFGKPAAVLSAVSSSLISGDAHLGLEYNSYLWRGFGLYTQLWAMHLAFITTARLYTTLRDGRHYGLTIVSLCALALSHLLFAYMMAITSIVMLAMLSTRDTWRLRTARLALVGVVSVAITSYMLVPFALSSAQFMNTSPDLSASGHTVARAAGWLFAGELMDAGRFPVVSILATVGIACTVLTFRQAANQPARFALVALVVWALLYLVHPSFGPLSALFPGHTSFVSARFISSFEMFVVMVIGASGEWLWTALLSLRTNIARTRNIQSAMFTAAFIALCLLLLLPAFIERGRYYAGNKRLVVATRDAVKVDTDLKTVLDAVARQSGGRIYAGLVHNWGADMHVGPTVRVSDVVRFAGLPIFGAPYQELSLSSTLAPLFREGDSDSFDWLDVRWVLTPAGAVVPPFYQPFLQTPHYTLYRTPSSGIAEYVGTTVPIIVGSQRALYDGNVKWYASDAIEKREAAQWDYSLRARSPYSAENQERCASGGQISEMQSNNSEVHIIASCATSSPLMFKFTYHPNWHVTVDGVTVPTFMVSPSFVAVSLTAGRHDVIARYVATPMKLPLLIFGLAVLGIALLTGDRLDRAPRRLARVIVRATPTSARS